MEADRYQGLAFQSAYFVPEIVIRHSHAAFYYLATPCFCGYALLQP